MILFGRFRRLRAIACLATAFILFPPVFPASAAAPGVGAHAPPLELFDLDGTARNVVWDEGSPAATIIFFFDPQSSECLLEMSFLDALYSHGHDFGLAVYAVETQGRQPAEVTRSLERYCRVYSKPSFPILADPAFRASRTFGVEAAPVTFVMEGHGIVLNRRQGYGITDAVAITRRVEQLLRQERGFFSSALRETGISVDEEQEAEARLTTAVAARASAPAKRALGVGDRAPEFEFTNLAGSTARWRWSGEPERVLRIVAFFEGLTLESIRELNWLDTLSRRGREAGLDVLAVETSGMGAAELQAALEKYRRYNPEPSFPVVPDPGGTLKRAFGPWETLPQTYLLGGDGSVVYHDNGFSAGESEIMAGKVERAFLLAGRPFPAARSDGGVSAPATVGEEAPSIRRQKNLEDRYRSAIVLGDAAFMAWEFEAALSHYLAALEVQPRDVHALVRAAQIYERRGEPGPALEYWERVLAAWPGHTEAGIRVRVLRQGR